MKRNLLALVAIAVSTASCDKFTAENIQEHNEGNIQYRWEMISTTGPDHVKLSVKDYPCLKDDQIVFYPDRTGKISQGNCVFFQGKAQDIRFSWHFSAISTCVLTSKDATTGIEGSNTAFMDGEGDVLTILETEPVFREYKYRKISD